MFKEPSNAVPSQMLLLVEDNPANILVATTLLFEFGFSFEVAENGIEAVRLYKQNKYALILMDLQMPIMDGIEATKHIREYEELHSLTAIPIIALTANNTQSERKQCLDSGMDDFLAKPYTPEQLKQIIKTHLMNLEHITEAS